MFSFFTVVPNETGLLGDVADGGVLLFEGTDIISGVKRGSASILQYIGGGLGRTEFVYSLL